MHQNFEEVHIRSRLKGSVHVPTFVRRENWNIAKLEHVSCPNVADAANQVCHAPSFWLPLSGLGSLGFRV